MEISKRNSLKLCQTVDSKSVANNLLQKSRCRLSQKFGAKNFYICSVFRRLRDLMANIFWMKHDIDSRARASESTSCHTHRTKIWCNWFTNSL